MKEGRLWAAAAASLCVHAVLVALGGAGAPFGRGDANATRLAVALPPPAAPPAPAPATPVIATPEPQRPLPPSEPVPRVPSPPAPSPEPPPTPADQAQPSSEPASASQPTPPSDATADSVRPPTEAADEGLLDTPLGFGDAVYYPAPMLDVVAEPLAAIDPLPMSPDPDLDPGAIQPARLVLRVFIDENGRVVATEVESAEPPGVLEEAALAAFGKATFAPAIRQGQKVKSVKRIAIESGGLSSPF